MNASAISPKSYGRLNRIKVASRIFRVLIGLVFCGLALGSATCFFGGLIFLPRGLTLTVVFSPHQQILFSSDQQFNWQAIPYEVLALAAVRFGLFGFCALVLNNLFRLFEQGTFFSARNVRYVRFLGYYLMLDWCVTYLLEAYAHEMQINLTQLFIGFIIIFTAWIMDEGRKIQEEQELTV